MFGDVKTLGWAECENSAPVQLTFTHKEYTEMVLSVGRHRQEGSRGGEGACREKAARAFLLPSVPASHRSGSRRERMSQRED